MKKAYTLMEVLMVVVIIGIIATLTMPVLLKGMPNKNKAYFRKSYSTFVQAISETANNQFLYRPINAYDPVFTKPNFPYTSSGEIDTSNSQYKNLQNVLGTTDALDEDNILCYALASILNLAEEANCKPPSTTSTTTTDDWNIHTVDGTKFYGLNGKFSNDPSKDDYTKTIYMKIKSDDNSKKELEKLYGTNRNANTNTTLFRLYLKANGQILVQNEPEKSYIQNAANVR